MPSIDLLVEDSRKRGVVVQYRLEVLSDLFKNPTTVHIYHRDEDFKERSFRVYLNQEEKEEMRSLFGLDGLYSRNGIKSRAYNFDDKGNLEQYSIYSGDFTDPDFRWSDSRKMIGRSGKKITGSELAQARSVASLMYSIIKIKHDSSKLIKEKDYYDFFLRGLKKVLVNR